MKFISLLFLLALISCKKDAIQTNVPAGIIENKTFNSTVLIDGHKYDGTIIRNCVFENIDGDGLQIRNADNLCVENSTFKNISGNAIRFRNSGSSKGVKIINNQIFNVKSNGILAPENHINTLIKGNQIYNIATDNTSSQFGSPHHGIYFQGFNVVITENKIYDILNDQGNCISIRTYGIISRNELFNATDHGISYYSDHPANSQELLIENNIIYDNGKRGINLASNGTTANHIGKALIRFNTLVSNSNSSIGINDALSDVSFSILGNVLIRTDDKTTFIFSSLPYFETNNIKSSVDIGFVNFANRNLHITNYSAAVNAAVGIIPFPALDFDGDSRTSSNLDVGADQL